MDLFVYGTLLSAPLMRAVSGDVQRSCVTAQLPGFAVRPLKDNVVPFIEADADGLANGVVWRDLTPQQMARLDLYEGAFGYVLTPVEVQTDAGVITAQCYLPPKGITAGQGNWSLEAWQEDHLAPALLAVEEIFAHDPLPDAATLRARWPMIEARAWSKHRATAAPATRRHSAGVADFALLASDPSHGSFFRFQSVNVQHRTFVGRASDRKTREAFIGIDAAMILPYDPVRDRVLLVEQARLGPRMRHDPNPWMLEPVAGIVDARETPQAAAIREAKEEAGLTIERLEEAGQFYVSPGASTDYFYHYVGICDLPQTAPYLGGLPEEGEDLRLHPMSFDDALALADSGEIATGPTIYLLYWLLRHKARLGA